MDISHAGIHSYPYTWRGNGKEGWVPASGTSRDSLQAEAKLGLTACCLGTHAAKLKQAPDLHPSCEVREPQGAVLSPGKLCLALKLLTNSQSLQTVWGQNFRVEKKT